ncbi:hypothetical protein EDD30_1270 [Couchioplanes caeruleus]|uniref:DUF1877 domain-containing protein n=3 Tax=Couchioplanes caeruleus TaxID=56438 RepID=A0A1K0FTD2_9ACTN|nr:hypothetical protein BG844_01410 [Couchioplanes caeruleus subsp. caeruleus]ROP28506.1 hypothetical protein EDD30_1270 [Couchioplanes caeruleus]
MGVLFDYFRAPGVDEVRSHMNENDAFSPVPETFDGIELKTIDPGVILGRLLGFATGRDWSTDLVGDRLIWPEGGEQDTAHEGPWVTILGDRARDVLADMPAERLPELAERWATVEEFDGYGDPEFLREVLADFAALAGRARQHGESLYCWMSL